MNQKSSRWKAPRQTPHCTNVLSTLLMVTFVLPVTSCQHDTTPNDKTISTGSNITEVASEYQVRRFVVQFPYKGESFDQNVYLLFDKTSRHGVIIDPGSKSPELEDAIASLGVTIKGILNTHGHFDHTGANGFYRDKYKAEVYAHSEDMSFYERNGDKPTRWISRDCLLQIGAIPVHVLCTPGHSPGSVCFQIGNHLFSGDTLFKGSIGRTPDNDATVSLVDHVRKKLLTLAPDTPVYPGHEGLSAIGVEKKENPYLQRGGNPGAELAQ